jgi:hypothetical protein
MRAYGRSLGKRDSTQQQTYECDRADSHAWTVKPWTY